MVFWFYIDENIMTNLTKTRQYFEIQFE